VTALSRLTEKAGLAGAGLGFSFGVAAGHYDQYGRPDLFIANAARTRSTTTTAMPFTNVTRSPASAANGRHAQRRRCWFDYDNDGLLDLVVSN